MTELTVVALIERLKDLLKNDSKMSADERSTMMEDISWLESHLG